MVSINQNDEIDKYTKGLVSTIGHLLGLREDREGKLQPLIVPSTKEDDPCCISIENVNFAAAQQWEAGALINTVAEMNIFPPDTVQRIRARIDEVSKTERKPPPVRVAPSSSSALTGAGGGTMKGPSSTSSTLKAPVQQDPFALSKGPGGFYPPRRVPVDVINSNNKSTEGIPPELQQRKQFTFAKPIPPVVESQNDIPIFSDFEPPPAKRPGMPQIPNLKGFSGGTTNNMIHNIANERVGQRNDAVTGAGDATGGGVFRTAYDLLKIEDKRKGIQRSLPPAAGGVGRTVGLHKPPTKALENNYKIEKLLEPPSKDDDPKVSDNPEVEELMTHESMKNIDPKMVESILHEVVQINTTTWDDIAGLEGVKQIIREIIIWPMERPELFVGIRSSARGILFFGPPGTGKTMFGRVIATESHSTFFNISASSLTSKWIGEGEKMVRALFTVARLKQPAVIFIDEIDSILTQRSDTEHESSRRLKTEFLIQFDGCATTSDDRILVIGVTNRPQELDEAARRRLVKRVYIPLPDFEARKQLVKKLVQEHALEMTDEDFDKVAKKTEGYSGADMSSLCREAAYGPIREFGHDIRNVDVTSLRSLKRKDFNHAMKQVKSSVSPSDVALYEVWDRKFGSHHAGSANNSATEDDDDDSCSEN